MIKFYKKRYLIALYYGDEFRGVYDNALQLAQSLGIRRATIDSNLSRLKNQETKSLRYKGELLNLYLIPLSNIEKGILNNLDKKNLSC